MARRADTARGAVPPRAPRRSGSVFARGVMRTVRGSLRRFLALATITALGVTMLVGLRAACDDLRTSADAFFDARGLFDVRVQSTLGLTDEDVAALAALDGVGAAEGGWSETVYTTVGSTSEKVDVRALSADGMNEPLVLEGELPAGAGEVAVTRRFLDDAGLSLGDTVTFRGADDGEEGATEVFSRGDYRIVGVVLDPQDINAGEGTMSFRSTGGAQYAFFVTTDALEPDAADVYTVAYLTVEGAEAPLCYSGEYEKIVDDVRQRVEDARGGRERARGEQLRADATAEVDDAEAEARAELADAEDELASGQAQIDDGRAEAESGQAELSARRDDALAELAEAQATIDDTAAALDAAQRELDAGYEQYEQGLAAYEAARPDAEAELRDGQAQLDAAREELYGTTVPGLEAQRDELQATVGQLQGTVSGLDGTALGLADGLGQLAGALPEGETRSAVAAAASEVRAAWEAVQAADEGSAGAATQRFSAAMAQAAEAVVPLAAAGQGSSGAAGGQDGADAAGGEDAPVDPSFSALIEQVIALGTADPSSEASAAALATGRVRAAQGLAQAQSGLDQVSAGIDQALSQGEATLAEQQAKIDAGWQQLEDGRAELDSARATLDASARQLADARAQLASGQAELDARRADALAQLADAQAQIDDALAQLNDAQAELDDARATYESERDDALRQIADARAEVADIDDATWYVQDRSSLSSYASVDSDASSIEAIGTAIPAVFFVVAVLVSLTTMTRMVEEERGLIGTYKALGYGRGRILSKYALYALAACLVGGVVGNVAGYVVLPIVIFRFFSTMYALPGFVLGFDALWALGATALFAVGIVGATLLACWRDLRETPASLILPKAPKAGARIFLERIGFVWRRMGFLNKVAARNLFRYKRRFLMTVFGVAGCVALLITGFGIRDTVISLSPRQYGAGGVVGYDLMAISTAEDLDAVAGDLAADPEVADAARIYVDSVSVTHGDDKESVQLYVVPDDVDLAAYVSLRDDAGDPIDLAEAGVVATKGLDQVMGLKVGDELSLQDSALNTGDVRLGAVALSYLGDAVYLSEDAYEAAFGTAAEPNALLAHLTGSADEQIAFAQRLTEDTRLLSVSSTQKLVNDFSGAFTLINLVVYVVIVLAAALALTVVFTLSTTNISERQRELATIKVLGFRANEVHRYINKETIILTLIGIVVGLPLGYALARSLTWILRMPSLYFDVVVDPLTYVISAAMALAFTLLVNLVTNRSLDRVDMVGALKSTE